MDILWPCTLHTVTVSSRDLSAVSSRCTSPDEKPNSKPLGHQSPIPWCVFLRCIGVGPGWAPLLKVQLDWMVTHWTFPNWVPQFHIKRSTDLIHLPKRLRFSFSAPETRFSAAAPLWCDAQSTDLKFYLGVVGAYEKLSYMYLCTRVCVCVSEMMHVKI